MPYKDKEKNKAYLKAYYEKHKKELNIKNKAWRDAHKEEIKAYEKLRYEATKEELRTYKKVYYETNKEEIKISLKEYREENKEEIRIRKKIYSDAHKEEKKAYDKIWVKANYDKVLARINRRRAKKANVIRQPIRNNFLDFLIKVWDGKCAYCKCSSDKWEQDHFMPLELNGHHAEYNLVLACCSCNRTKSYKHPQVWLKEKGYTFTKPEYMLDTNHRSVYSLTMSNTTCSCNLDLLEKPFYKLLVDTDEGTVEVCEDCVEE